MLVYFQITESFDQFVISSVADNVGNPSLDIVMQIITESGDTIWMLGFGILMLLIKKTRRIGITLMILIVLSTSFIGVYKYSICSSAFSNGCYWRNHSWRDASWCNG